MSWSFAEKNSVLVKKYGGTSVGTIERIERLADRLVSDVQRGQKPIVVVSAMAGETNRLVSMAAEIDRDYRGPAYDMLVASGEQVSVALLTIALQKRGQSAQAMLAHQIGIYTDSIFSKARIQKVDGHKLLALAERGIIPVVAGFQGVDAESNITTLGRGGSDTTAVALAAAIGATTCEIYTDVPAIFSADPRLVPKAREIPYLSFEEMMEMASLGSKVLHSRSVEIGAKYGVKIHLRSTFESREGTWVGPEEEVMEQAVVSSVTHDSGTYIFKLHPVPEGSQFLADLFSRLADAGVSVDIITQSESTDGTRLAFSVNKEDFPLARKLLHELLPSHCGLSVIEDMAKLSIVGVGMRTHPGVAARFFKVLASLNVAISLVTTSEIKISAVIAQNHLDIAARALHTEFNLDAN